ncbi:hypothetical protein [Desulfocurvibacter africanus]|uniref:Uncharacterized protein n=1 Tax=Desulfocurvibacter africanus subsp. africanus str. Walvis Bay TaxID=690850 RepID=F3YXE5_DESAF|nr:hypothetical protein [Desulfocurvibacter africanus]EGJ51722.1 hypothetical protein Desaf_3436 [Desulfocurvibacter africanus subsp. africanus str. Walvis Bay]
MSEYVQQLNNISQTLRDGIGAIARDRLNRSVMDLEDTRLDYGLAKDKREWDLRAPGLELERQKAQGELDRLNAPVQFKGIFGDTYSQLHGVHQPKDGRPPLYSQIEGMFGAKFDVAPDSKTRGHLLRPDGTSVSQRELEGRLPEVSTIIAMETDPDRAVNDVQERVFDQLEAGQGDPVEHKRKLQVIDEYWKNPNKRLEAYQRKLEFLERQSGPKAQAMAEKTQAKIDALQAAMVAAEDEARNREWMHKVHAQQEGEIRGRQAGTQPAQQPTTDVSQQGQGMQMAQGGSALPAEVTNALMGSPGKALRFRNGGQERIFIYRNGQIDELSPAEAQAMGQTQAQADGQRGASGNWGTQGKQAQAANGQGGFWPSRDTGADIAAGERTRARLENNVVARVGRAPAEWAVDTLFQGLVAVNNGIAQPFMAAGNALGQALRDFQYWAKNNSPNARAIQGKEAVRQFLTENPEIAMQLAQSSQGRK